MTKFKKGDLVHTPHYGDGYFVCYQEGNKTQCIIERIDDLGWSKSNNPDLIPKDYAPINHESCWSINIDELELIQPVISYEEIY